MQINNSTPRGFLFDSVKIETPQRTAFDLSNENRLSCNMGFLVPTLLREVLPNDDINLASSFFARFAPTLAPIMQKVDVMVYSFFVPNRILWKDWPKFISPGDGSVTMASQPTYVPPQKPYFTIKSLIDDFINFLDTVTQYDAQYDVSPFYKKYVSIFELLDYLNYGIPELCKKVKDIYKAHPSDYDPQQLKRYWSQNITSVYINDTVHLDPLPIFA